MNPPSILPSQEAAFESLIDGLLSQQYGLADRFLAPDLVAGLRDILLARQAGDEMHEAGIGRNFSYARNLKVRGDEIAWIDEQSEDPFEKAFMAQVRAFVDHLNRTCYAGINAFEFHYARYDAGTFYRRHRDQFQSDHGRKFSLVTYLNEDWRGADEGNLVLYLEGGEAVNVLPLGGRSVFFRSDELEHEVKPSPRERLSIAGWLKRV
jgi:SM-20-related protein